MTGFGFGSDFTIGMEEEILLVDGVTLGLTPVASEVLASMGADPAEAGHEAYAAQIELRSPPSETATEAAAALGQLRRGATDAGATLIPEITARRLMDMNLPDLPFDRELLPSLEHARLVQKVHLVNGLNPSALAQIFNGDTVGLTITAGREGGQS